MVSPDQENRRGIMNDWDLSFDREGALQHVGGERTGTVPFMALDLLTEEYWAGTIPRLYRHDLEGLIWVLPWVFLQYENGSLTVSKLKSWRTGDYFACQKEKRTFLAHFRKTSNYLPTRSWATEWELAYVLLDWIHAEDYNRQRRVRTWEEPSNAHVRECFWKEVEQAKTNLPSLSYIELPQS